MDDPSNTKDLRQEMQDMRDKDEAAHGMLSGKLDTISLQQVRMQVVTEERSAAETSLRKQMFALLLLFLGSMGGLIGWTTSEFRDLYTLVNNNTAHFMEFQAIGIRWGEDIDDTATETREDLRQLRRLVNEHQRNNKKHLR